jgi:hypothetical protein
MTDGIKHQPLHIIKHHAELGRNMGESRGIYNTTTYTANEETPAELSIGVTLAHK